MASLWVKMVAAYDQHGYKSDATRKGAMTRDARTKARVVVSDESQWDPRKNDLKGFDDGSQQTRAPANLNALRVQPLSNTETETPAVLVNKEVAKKAVQQKIYVPIGDVTVLPIASMNVAKAMLVFSKKYQYKDPVYLYTGHRYSQFQDAVRRNLQPVSKNISAGGLNQEMQLTEPLKPHNWDVQSDDWEEYIVESAKALNHYINLTFVPSLPDADTLVVYRGTRDVPFLSGVLDNRARRYMSNYLDSQLQVGQIISLSGFTSTTLSPSFAAVVATSGSVEDAYKFFSSKSDNHVMSQGTLMQFELPAMYPAFYYELMDEYEVILPFTIDYQFPVNAPTKHYPMPRWLVTKRDTITIKVRDWTKEMEGATKSELLKPSAAKYITITRVVLRPMLRGTVKF